MNTKNRPRRTATVVTLPRRPRRMAPGAETNANACPVVAPPRPMGAPVEPSRQAAVVEARRSCRHPLSRIDDNDRLLAHEKQVRERLAAIQGVLQRVAAEQHCVDFASKAQQLCRQELGFDLPESLLEGAWIGGLDMRAIYGAALLATLRAIAEQVRLGSFSQQGAPHDTAVSFFLDCGYHAVDISPCCDGRLKGLIRYILRLPDEAIRYRKAYAGAMFDVEANVARWMEAELARYRDLNPVGPEVGSRYLKIAVYHWSGSDPLRMGCAAHASNRRRAAAGALQRLREFRQAIENRFCCGASVDTLLIGVDTDTDAITVHVPDSQGELSLHRTIDNLELYNRTVADDPNTAYLRVYEAIEAASEQEGWGRGSGQPSEGMRRLVATLLINNLSQIDYVCATQGGRYGDVGHAEHFISVGDGFEEFQLRNIAYYVHLQTLEEGATDMDVGVKILEELNVARGLPVVVAVHYRYDRRVPGSRDRMVAKCRRVTEAIRVRYADLVTRGLLVCGMTVQDQAEGSPIEVIDCDSALSDRRGPVEDQSVHFCVDLGGKP